MWRADLETRGHRCVYLNAWESDFATDPLIALVGELRAELERLSPKAPGVKQARKPLKKLEEIGLGFAKKAAPIALRVLSQGLVTEGDVVKLVAEGFGDASEEFLKSQLEEYSSTKSSLEAFREQLKNFAAAVAADENARGPTVIFVDELDRCRPTYAIELLRGAPVRAVRRQVSLAARVLLVGHAGKRLPLRRLCRRASPNASPAGQDAGVGRGPSETVALWVKRVASMGPGGRSVIGIRRR